MYSVSDDIPDDDEIVGDHPDIPVEVVKDIKAKIIKNSSKGVLVK